ncbi:hypothetical protein N7478_001326 [Penicillium angulare]|uniref:uncharacterized protein n=1 Tax=Penicillium angulare TaxID=116970 RepID=UPI00253FB98B|nr:uncharacterized protein N7478_001326 [Penicillium angulare]KAJ5292075.1 hypothetical protein N7478_001326 [Penicillium angulare]
MGDCVELIRYLLLNQQEQANSPLLGCRVYIIKCHEAAVDQWRKGQSGDQHVPTKAFLISKGAKNKGAIR